MRGILINPVKVSGSANMVYTSEHDMIAKATTEKIVCHLMKGEYLISQKIF